MATKMVLSDVERETLLDRWEVLHTGREGDFYAAVWKHVPSGIPGGTFGGHLSIAELGDEGDRVWVCDKALDFIERMRPSRFLWNLSPLRSIDLPVMRSLIGFQRRLSERARCVVVPPIAAFQAAAAFTALPAPCRVSESVQAGLAWLVQEHRSVRKE